MKNALLILAITSCLCGASPADAPRRWTPGAIATAGYEAAPSFSVDGGEMIYLSADSGFAGWRLLRSVCEDGGWSVPAPPGFAAPAPVIEADPGFTPDGQASISSRRGAIRRTRISTSITWRATRTAVGVSPGGCPNRSIRRRPPPRDKNR